jgi:regulator of replication initiation timing
MRFEASLEPSNLYSRAGAQYQPKTHARTGTMQAELQLLEAQYKGLQTLVGELLMTNQRLRAEVVELRKKADTTAPATRLQPHPDR